MGLDGMLGLVGGYPKRLMKRREKKPRRTTAAQDRRSSITGKDAGTRTKPDVTTLDSGKLLHPGVIYMEPGRVQFFSAENDGRS